MLCCDWSEKTKGQCLEWCFSFSVVCVFTHALCVPFCDLSERVSVQGGVLSFFVFVSCLCVYMCTVCCLWIEWKGQ